MTAPAVTYLTHDSVAEGIGVSQVLSYVEALASHGLTVHLHSFEKQTPATQTRERLERAGVSWTPHPFGPAGVAGGVGRVLSGARAVRGSAFVHARSDMAAASAMLAGVERWLWDVRSLWADQRIALGALREGGPEHRVLQRIERAAAHRSAAVVTLTDAVLPVLEQRHAVALRAHAQVIPTCVDLERFSPAELPPMPIRLLLAGTLNAYYDVPLMARLASVGRRRSGAVLDVLCPGGSPWDALLAEAGAHRDVATPRQMPGRVAASHVGLSVCRRDAGVSLTAAMPTKIAEFLAVGRPVVVNPGLGDADVLVREAQAGVVLHDTSDEGLERAWDQLEELLADPATPLRCRALAERHFSLDVGVNRLIDAYDGVLSGA
jgi:glycosyltransferase involved in cell wall biosynthesis